MSDLTNTATAVAGNPAPPKNRARGVIPSAISELPSPVDGRVRIKNGTRFGRLVVIAPVKVSKGRSRSLCRCDCGKEIEVLNNRLNTGGVRSCGCLRKDSIDKALRMDIPIGTRFGKLVVMGKVAVIKGPSRSLCRCDCGNVIEAQNNILRYGRVRSCGCLSKDAAERLRSEIQTGTRFGRLVVIGKCNDGNGKSTSRCKCDCGKIIVVRNNSLKSGKVASCGCLRKEVTSKLNRKHGCWKTRIFRIWNGMRRRCLTRSNIQFKDYGGRGISICEEWRSDFTAFRDWAIAHGYADNLSIDRINNDGNYEPSNCRWVDQKTQSRNRRSTVLIKFMGIKRSMKEWCEVLGLKYSTVLIRHKKGITGEELLKPTTKGRK